MTEPGREAETRRTVTILFADVTGSTGLAERLDPEAVRRVMAQYFAIARAAMGRHGGTVEKFIGDAVMAVFGLDVLHEDDALRAVRAAIELRHGLAGLDDELEEELGVSLGVRIGVMTGEIVTGGPAERETLVTGDAVNVAARLQAAAEPLEIVIGDPTFRLVRSAVQTVPLGRLELKGRSEPVHAHRVIEAIAADAPARQRTDTPMVGREVELTALGAAFGSAVASGRPWLVTVVGIPGVGKSRLVDEFATRIAGRATVLRGRCLSYGESITWWPIVEAVHEAAGIAPTDDRRVAIEAIERLVVDADGGPLIADRVATLVGLSDKSIPAAEAEWAIRRLLDHLATRRPVAVVVDDIQWAEPALLDLLERLIDDGDAPVLVVAMARPEVADRRPAWLERSTRSTVVGLESLDAAEAERLIDGLLGETAVAAGLRRRILESADGNPLFVEQFVAMLGDAGIDADRVPVPPSIQALLAARIDRLGAHERPALSRGSVVGAVFWAGAVTDLTPSTDRDTVHPTLAILEARQFIQREPSDIPDDSAYRFRHILVRDAAYATLPKAQRADLHEAVAAWLERRAGDRSGELGEILGYHYETAAGYVRELGLGRGRRQALEEAAAIKLLSAGDRAFRRGDMPAAAALLARAAGLLPLDDGRRVAAMPTLAKARVETGDLDGATSLLDDTIARASALGDATTEHHARAHRLLVRIWSDPDTEAAAIRAEAELLRGSFEASGDVAGQALAWSVLTEALWIQGRNRDAEAPARRVVDLARQAGDERMALEYLALLASGSLGHWPLEKTIAICRAAIAEAGGSPIVSARALPTIGAAEALRGRPDVGRALVAEGIEICRDLGMLIWEAEMAGPAADVEEAAGDRVAARDLLLQAWTWFREVGDRAHEAYYAAALARVATLSGSVDDADTWLVRCHEAAPDGRHAASGLPSIVASWLARRRGDLAQAESVARDALRDFDDRGNLAAVEARLALGAALRTRGRTAEADEQLRAALATATEIGATVLVPAIERAIADPRWPEDALGG